MADWCFIIIVIILPYPTGYMCLHTPTQLSRLSYGNFLSFVFLSSIARDMMMGVYCIKETGGGNEEEHLSFLGERQTFLTVLDF